MAHKNHPSEQSGQQSTRPMSAEARKILQNSTLKADAQRAGIPIGQFARNIQRTQHR